MSKTKNYGRWSGGGWWAIDPTGEKRRFPTPGAAQHFSRGEYHLLESQGVPCE